MLVYIKMFQLKYMRIVMLRLIAKKRVGDDGNENYILTSYFKSIYCLDVKHIPWKIMCIMWNYVLITGFKMTIVTTMA